MEAHLWLLKNSVTPEKADALGMSYSKRLDRVIIPISKKGHLLGIQCRSLVEDRSIPKYLNLPSGPAFRTLLWQLGNGVPIVVEDIMSAIAVAKVGRGVSLLGTSATMEVITEIAEMGPRAVVWLDGDKAGRKGANKVARSLELQGVEVMNLCTENDPKHYSKREMQGLIPWTKAS
jgi:DNA primase